MSIYRQDAFPLSAGIDACETGSLC